MKNKSAAEIVKELFGRRENVLVESHHTGSDGTKQYTMTVKRSNFDEEETLEIWLGNASVHRVDGGQPNYFTVEARDKESIDKMERLIRL